MPEAHPIRRRRRCPAPPTQGPQCPSPPPFLTPRVLSILLTETAERFSYFGFRAILVLYFTFSLGYSEPTSVALFAYVSCAAYVTPLFGAVVADAYLGRYRTILWFGVCYWVGLVVLTYGAYLPGLDGENDVTADGGGGGNGDEAEDQQQQQQTEGGEDTDVDLTLKKWCTLVGLGLACVGTGGIKPCVSAFGADQVASDDGDGDGDGDDGDGDAAVGGVGGTSSGRHRDGRSSRSLATVPECDDRGEMVRLEMTGVGSGHDASSAPDDGALSSSSDDATNNNSSNDKNDNVRAFFAYFYFCINVGALTSIFIVPVIRGRYGFGAAFLAPTLFLCFAMILFVAEKGAYRMHTPGGAGENDVDGSLYTTFRVLVLLLRERMRDYAGFLPLCCGGGGGSRDATTRRRGRARFHKVSTSSPIEVRGVANDNGVATSWRDEDGSSPPDNGASTDGPRRPPAAAAEAFSQQQIDDAEQVLHVMPILALLPTFWMLYDQQGSVWTLQATRMELHGLQPEQLNIVNPVEIMILIPVFDRCVYPTLERLGWNVTHLRRMACGMLLTSVSFVVSGLLETTIQSRDHDGGENGKVSVFWQVPQITILATAEILLSVTGLEFAYSNSPERMKALIMATYLLTTSVGDFMGGILYSSVFRTLNRATTMHVCAAIMLCNLALFWQVAKWWEGQKADNEEGSNGDGRDGRMISSSIRSSCVEYNGQSLDRRKSSLSESPSSSSGDYVEMNNGRGAADGIEMTGTMT